MHLTVSPEREIAGRGNPAAAAGGAPVTAVILTFNNAAIIGRTLRSAAFCREIVVVDSGSTDETPEICRAAGARVFSRALDSFAAQRNHGAKLYRRDAAHFKGAVHERLEIRGPVGALRHPIASYCQPTLSSVMASYNLYTTKEAGTGGGRVGCRELIWLPLRRLLGHLFVLGAVREGKHGLVKAVMDSFYAFLLAAKRWELSLDHGKESRRP